MMQAWLEENMPAAEMTECSVRIENITYSAHVYLTDYVTGRICVSEEEKIFAMDTATGEVYFECSPFVKEQLNELAAGVEDLEAFVREPASRPLLYVRANITLPEETDLFAYDFAVPGTG